VGRVYFGELRRKDLPGRDYPGGTPAIETLSAQWAASDIVNKHMRAK